jgi:hypothetical protein
MSIIYEYIPVNKPAERSNLSTSYNSPMFEGRVNPMFPCKLMSTPFVFILMIEIGSSPERKKRRNEVKSKQEKGGAVELVHQGLFHRRVLKYPF